MIGPTPEGDDEAMSEINTTPLIDVMLVLLIMLIVTIPAARDAVQLGLSPAAEAPAPPPARIVLAIDAAERMRWNDESVPDLAGLEARLRALAATPNAAISLRPDPAAPYRALARAMAAIEREGPGLAIDLVEAGP